MSRNGTDGWWRLDRRTLGLTAAYLLGYVTPPAALTALLLLRGGLGAGRVALYVAGPALLVLVAGVLVDLVRWRWTSYRISRTHLDRRFDFLVRHRTSVRLDRVRVVDLHATVGHRLLGLTRLTVRTGQQDARGEGTVTLDPLPRDVGEQLRVDLLRRSTAAAPLLSFSRSWLRFAPFSLATPVLGASALGLTLQAAEWLDLQGRLVDAVRDLAARVGVGALTVLGGVAALVLGSAAGSAVWVERWWSYRLTRGSGTLLVRRGLIGTRSLGLEEHRLRGLELVEPLGARLLGAAKVDAVAVGLATPYGTEKDHDLRTLVPVVPRAAAERVVAEVLGASSAPTAVPLTRHPPAARRRRLGWASAAAAGLAVSLLVLEQLLFGVPGRLAWPVAAAGLLVGVGFALDAHRNLGHALTGPFLVARRGSLRRSTVALQRGGVVGWRVTSSPFQRRSGLVTLAALTAAGSGAYRIPDVGAGHGLAFAEQATPGILTPFLEPVAPVEPEPARWISR